MADGGSHIVHHFEHNPFQSSWEWCMPPSSEAKIICHRTERQQRKTSKHVNYLKLILFYLDICIFVFLRAPNHTLT